MSQPTLEIVVNAFFPLVRYLLFAGLAYWVFWKKLAPRFAHRRTHAKPLPNDLIRHEFLWSFSTSAIFGTMAVQAEFMRRAGGTRIYQDISEYGVPYLVFSVFLLIVLHDAWFYFTHRALHHPLLFRFHKTHHRSMDPSPFAAFSFHPVEAFINGVVATVFIVLFPFHPIALVIWLFYTIIMNVVGHVGHDFYPRGMERTRWWAHFNATTHHSMHHTFFNCNYGLYFNWLDRIFGTNHPEYARTFVRNTTRARLEECGASTKNSVATS